MSAARVEQAALPVTFEQEFQSLARARGPQVKKEEVQTSVRDIVRRHVAAGLTLTELLLIPETGLRFFAELFVTGKEWTASNGGSVQDLDGEHPWSDGVQLCSIVRAKDGTYVPIEHIKTGPPIPGTSKENRARDVRGLPRYPTTSFPVDPKTGHFKKLVRPELAILLLRNHGAVVRAGRRFLQLCAHPRHTHEPGFCKNPNGVRDEWLISEPAFLAKAGSDFTEAARPKQTQNMIQVVTG